MDNDNLQDNNEIDTTKGWPNWVKTTFGCLIIFVLLCVVLPVVYNQLSQIYPDLLVFGQYIVLENKTDEVVYVTGLTDTRPNTRTVGQHGGRLRPGRSMNILYDPCDTYLDEVAICRADGVCYLLPDFTATHEKTYTLTDFSSLSDVPAHWEPDIPPVP